jgi:hypothetical protein
MISKSAIWFKLIWAESQVLNHPPYIAGFHLDSQKFVADSRKLSSAGICLCVKFQALM